MTPPAPNWPIDGDDTSAKAHFARTKRPYTEDIMIDIIKNRPDKFDLYWAASALMTIGTEKSIEHLKTLAHHKSREIQGTCVLAIAKIANGAENDFVGKLLLDREFKQKWHAMRALLYMVNDTPLPYVIEYAVRTLKSRKKMPQSGELALTYLARFAPENEKCGKIFTKVNKNFDNLYPHTQKKLKEEFPDIFGINPEAAGLLI